MSDTSIDANIHAGGLPRCSVVDIYKPRWPHWARIYLVCAVCAALAVSAGVLWSHSSVEPAVISFGKVFVRVGVVLTALVLISSVGDRFRAISMRRQFERLGGGDSDSSPSALSSDDLVSREIQGLALCNHRDIPGRYTPVATASLPDAIILRSPGVPGWSGRSITNPVSNSVPFEPMPLGRDPRRMRILLEEFVGQRCDVKYPELARLTLNHPSVLQNIFSISHNLVVAALVMLLWFFAMRDISVHYFLYPMLGLVGASCVFQLGLQIARWHRENTSPSCWLFPGVVAIRSPSGGKSSSTGDLIARRGSGVLWYDAGDGKLFVPLPEGGFRTLRCSLHEGLLAVWAWLNTAQSPDYIQLDDIA